MSSFLYRLTDTFILINIIRKTHGNAGALSRRLIFLTIAAIKTVQNSGFQNRLYSNTPAQNERLDDLIAYLKSDPLAS